jgi:hypothetical protein
MASESEYLEFYYASGTLGGLIRSGFTLLNARRVRPKSEAKQRELHLSDLLDRAIFVALIVIPAFFLDTFQRLRSSLTGEPRAYPQGMWQFYLHWGLREDLAHFTNETTGYHRNRPAEATELDDLTAWVMTVIQFVWGYEELMGVVWDEWTMLRLISEAAEEAGLKDEPQFRRLSRQWELARPYRAPLNGTYADIRWAKFYAFSRRVLDTLPADLQKRISEEYNVLAEAGRKPYQKQMSVLARLAPGRRLDSKEPIPLWDACIGVVLGGRYHLIHVAAHDENGAPVVYGQGGSRWPLQFRNGSPVGPDGTKLILDGDQFYRARDGQWVGYLDMAPASFVEWQLRSIFEHPPQEAWEAEQAVDILLAETPRKSQNRLRGMLPKETQQALKQLSYAPVILNWDQKPRDRSLAELRRTHRGIGDHALTIIRAEDSIIFDQSHVFFDGAWSLAMAEVLTNAAVHWCQRCIDIAPSEAPPPRALRLEPSGAFLKEARLCQQVPEISAETTIFDISQIFKLRKMLAETGTHLTINDLLVITRIFHAAHYRPSRTVQQEINSFQANARSPAEQRAVAAIEHSLKRGRLINPALLIPVDASLHDPQDRLFPITFRNLADNLVWIWDETWDAYQAYRKIEPPDTPEGLQALQLFARRRTFLIGNLRAFSYILDANKAVALRGESLTVAIAGLLVHLPAWMQHLLNLIPEQFTVLNEIIKGDEVYSNVGRVATGSSLTRFMTAKDDGNTKALAWGIMTDDEGRMIITMRDFRPHVTPLFDAGRIDLARDMAQDYVVSYTQDLIGLVARLAAMLQTETPGPGAGKAATLIGAGQAEQEQTA